MGISNARKAANARYLAKFERINLTVTAEQKEAIKAAAESVGKSLTSYILYKIFNDTVQDSIGQDTPNTEPRIIPPDVLAKIEANATKTDLPQPPPDILAGDRAALGQWLHDHGYNMRQARQYMKDI